MEEGGIMLAGGVGVEVGILTFVAEKESNVGFGGDLVKRKGDAGTSFEMEAFVLKRRL